MYNDLDSMVYIQFFAKLKMACCSDRNLPALDKSVILRVPFIFSYGGTYTVLIYNT